MDWKALWLSLGEVRTWVNMVLTAAIGGAFVAAADWYMANPGTWDPARIKGAAIAGAVIAVGNHFRNPPKPKNGDGVNPARFTGPGPTGLVVLLALTLFSGCGTMFRVGHEPMPALPQPDIETAIGMICRGETEVVVKSYLEDRVDSIAQGAPAARASLEEAYYRAWRSAVRLHVANAELCKCFDGKGTCQ